MGDPVRAIRLVVLLAVPEGAVVHRVDAHAAVVSPAIAPVLLHSGAVRDDLWRFHLTKRIGRDASEISDARLHGFAGSAQAHRDVANLIHGYARHPDAHRR